MAHRRRKRVGIGVASAKGKWRNGGEANVCEMKIVINRVSIMKYQHQRHGVWRMAWIEIKQSI
jgi:hypothetical protein